MEENDVYVQGQIGRKTFYLHSGKLSDDAAENASNDNIKFIPLTGRGAVLFCNLAKGCSTLTTEYWFILSVDKNGTLDVGFVEAENAAAAIAYSSFDLENIRHIERMMMSDIDGGPIFVNVY